MFPFLLEHMFDHPIADIGTTWRRRPILFVVHVIAAKGLLTARHATLRTKTADGKSAAEPQLDRSAAKMEAVAEGI